MEKIAFLVAGRVGEEQHRDGSNYSKNTLVKRNTETVQTTVKIRLRVSSRLTRVTVNQPKYKYVLIMKTYNLFYRTFYFYYLLSLTFILIIIITNGTCI